MSIITDFQLGTYTLSLAYITGLVPLTVTLFSTKINNRVERIVSSSCADFVAMSEGLG